MRGPDDVVGRLTQLGQHRAIEVELPHDALERLLDVTGNVRRRDEGRREIGHEGLEAEALGQLVLSAPPLSAAAEQPGDQRGLRDERGTAPDHPPAARIPHRPLAEPHDAPSPQPPPPPLPPPDLPPPQPPHPAPPAA